MNPLLVVTLSGPIAASLTTRYGCRKITILGSILAALGLASSVIAPSIYFLFITIGFTAGAGFGLIYLPAIVCVTCYFEKRRAFATGLAVCGAGIGSAVFAPLINWLIMTLKWRGAMLVISLIVLSCALFGCLFRPLPFDTDDEEVDDEDDDEEIDDEEDDEEADFNNESMHLADSTSEVVKVHAKLPRYSLDNSTKNSTLQKSTMKSSTMGKKTPIYRNTLQPSPAIAVSNNYLKPKSICYSASVLSLPHYKSSPALFAVDSIVVGSNSTFGCKVASHSVRILNANLPDDYSIKTTDTVDMNNVSIYKNHVNGGKKKNKNHTTTSSNNNNNEDSISNDVIIINSSSASSRGVETSYVKMIIKFFTDFEILKNRIFVIFAISNLATSLGFYVPHIYIKDKVKDANYINTVDVNGEVIEANVDQIITDSDAAQLIGLIGLGSTVGRLVFGYLSDQEYINRLWVYIVCVSASGASVIAYAFTNSYSMLAVCSVTYGLTGGGYVSLTSVLIVDLLGLDKLTSAVSYLLSVSFVHLILAHDLLTLRIQLTTLKQEEELNQINRL